MFATRANDAQLLEVLNYFNWNVNFAAAYIRQSNILPLSGGLCGGAAASYPEYLQQEA